MRRKSIFILLLLVMLFLSSCSLLPEEEDFGTIPVLKQVSDPDYNLTYVARGELSVTKSFTPKFSPSVETYLSFGEAGLYFDKIYVSKGDSVKKGDLLATLQMDDVKEQLASCESDMERLQIRMRQTTELYDLRIEHLRASETATEEDMKQLLEEYDNACAAITDEITVLEVKIEDLNKKINDRQIYATMDGTISYVRNIEDGALSKINENIIKISDLSSNLFTTSTENPDNFDHDTVYTIISSSVEYNTHYKTAEDIGVPEEISDTGKVTIYFEPDDPAAVAELSDGATGSLTIVLDYRADTLFVPNKAIQTQGGQTGVYVKDENGLQTFIRVETGIVNSKYTEILSGLNEGDEVIVK